MTPNRRQFLKTTLAASAFAAYRPTRAEVFGGRAQDAALGIPGPYPGRVASARHTGAYDGAYRRGPIGEMLHRSMMELTDTTSPEAAWRTFFSPGDVVGLKLNAVGAPHVISSPEMVAEIIAGLGMAGVPVEQIVAYDRQKSLFLRAGFDTWLPEGLRWTFGTDQGHPLQLDMDGYDPEVYIELPYVLPRADPDDPHHRRSYMARFLTREVDKMINLCVLKHHQSAGVTLALKNLSHGLVNNVSRSHSTPTLNTCGTFIPAIVDHPVIRQKVVLHILDGIRGAYHGGPFARTEEYVWNHDTVYAATDPVALDKVGWEVIDAKRAEVGRDPVGQARPDEDSRFYRMQPEHVEIAGVVGLGVFDDDRIERRAVELG